MIEQVLTMLPAFCGISGSIKTMFMVCSVILNVVECQGKKHFTFSVFGNIMFYEVNYGNFSYFRWIWI